MCKAFTVRLLRSQKSDRNIALTSQRIPRDPWSVGVADFSPRVMCYRRPYSERALLLVQTARYRVPLSVTIATTGDRGGGGGSGEKRVLPRSQISDRSS